MGLKSNTTANLLGKDNGTTHETGIQLLMETIVVIKRMLLKGFANIDLVFCYGIGTAIMKDGQYIFTATRLARE